MQQRLKECDVEVKVATTELVEAFQFAGQKKKFTILEQQRSVDKNAEILVP